MNCKYWDCGWCYAPDGVENNSFYGECNLPEECPYLKSQMNDADAESLFGKTLRVYNEVKPRITRAEVIDENGRSYVNWCDDNDVTFSVQDEGQTLKVFVTKVKPEPNLEDWLGPEPPEEPEMTEIEKTKREIETLQTKLKILERQETTSTPCEKAYRDAYGTYPVTGMDASTWHVTTWRAFQKGYDAGLTHKALKRGQKIHKEMEEAVNKLEEEGTWNYNPDKKFDTTEDMIDGLMKDPPDFLKFSLGPTLYEVIEDWYFYTTDTSVLDLVQRIEKWLPPEQSSAGTQSTETEIAVEAHNELLNKIKSKLKNTK